MSLCVHKSLYFNFSAGSFQDNLRTPEPIVFNILSMKDTYCGGGGGVSGVVFAENFCIINITQ